MVYGSILGKSNEKIELVTANNKKAAIQSKIQRLGLRIIGMPHTEMRTRWRRISNNLNLKEGMKVLDAGCGIGLNSLELSDKRIDIIGVDLSEEKIINAKSILGGLNLHNIKFEEGDITSLKFGNKTFDKVICSDVLEHVDEDVKALKEISRVLKNGGEAVFTFPSITSHSKKVMKEYGHVRAGYNAKSFNEKLKGTDMRIVKVKGYSYLFGKIAWWMNNKLFFFTPLAALMFYPLYLLTFLDEIFPIGNPDGCFIKTRKYQ